MKAGAGLLDLKQWASEQYLGPVSLTDPHPCRESLQGTISWLPMDSMQFQSKIWSDLFIFLTKKSTSEDRRTGSAIKNTCHPYREPRFNFQHLHEATHKHWKFQLQRVQGPLLAASSTCTQTKIKTEKQNETPKEFHLLILKCLPNYKNTWALKWFCKRTKLEERADSAVVDYGCGNLERHTCM